jgi:hypothetical protein
MKLLVMQFPPNILLSTLFSVGPIYYQILITRIFVSSGIQHCVACYQLHAGFLFGLLRNVC